MRLRSRSNTSPELASGTIRGVARLGRNSRALLSSLRPGDIAVVDHLDIDRNTARALVDAGVVGVVNAAPSISGRYPNLGPEFLAEAGIAHIDMVGPEVFAKIKDGAKLTLDGGNVLMGDRLAVAGRSLEATDVVQLMSAARRGLESQLQNFTANTVEFLRREQSLLLHGEGVPNLRTKFEGRPVVVVVAGFDYRADLKRLRRFAKEQRPAIIAVDAGADAARDAGLPIDLLVISDAGLGHRTASGAGSAPVSDKAISAAREVVVHADSTGRAGGVDRLEKLGIDYAQLDASATTEDAALLIADLGRASVIVTVGVHATLDEFLDRQRVGLASTFLTQLRVAPKLIDARAVPLMYAGRVRRWHLVAVTVAGLLAVGGALLVTPEGHDAAQPYLDDVRGWFTTVQEGLTK